MGERDGEKRADLVSIYIRKSMEEVCRLGTARSKEGWWNGGIVVVYASGDPTQPSLQCETDPLSLSLPIVPPSLLTPFPKGAPDEEGEGDRKGGKVVEKAHPTPPPSSFFPLVLPSVRLVFVFQGGSGGGRLVAWGEEERR